MSRDPKVDNAFKQLDGALCLWARAKGETPATGYFEEVTPNVRRLLLDGKVFQIILTAPDDEEDTK